MSILKRNWSLRKPFGIDLSSHMWRCYFADAARRLAAGLVIFSLLSLSTPGAPEWTTIRTIEVTRDARSAFRSASYALSGMTQSFYGFFIGNTRKKRKDSLVRIEIQPTNGERSLEMMQGQTVNFSAVGFGQQSPVAAKYFDWTVADSEGSRSTRKLVNGLFKAERPGTFQISASADGVRGAIAVTVKPDEGYAIRKLLAKPEGKLSERERESVQRLREGGSFASREIDSRTPYDRDEESELHQLDRQQRELIRQRQDSRRTGRTDISGQNASENTDAEPAADTVNTLDMEDGENSASILRVKGGPRIDEDSAVGASRYSPRAPMFRPADDDGWGGDDWYTADDPGNAIGSPAGSAPDAGAGNGNYRFMAPVLSLEGRGIDLDLTLVYNSRVWNKSGSVMKFDSDMGFPAPGWTIGFGKMIYMGSTGGCMIQTADGSRQSHTGNNYTSSYGTYYGHSYIGKTTDGSFIDYNCAYSSSTYGTTLSGFAQMSNGTTIIYGAPSINNNQLYPTRITDAQGNFINVTYKNNQGPRIDTVTDTLGRTITFNYDGSQRLISVTAPGYGGTTRTYVQLHYKQLTLGYAFAPGYTTDTATGSPWVIDAIYYPDTSRGFWFGETDSYSSYGMIAKLIFERGMGWTGAPNTQGTVSRGTAINRTEEYNFPMTATSTLTDAPTYTTYGDTWDKMDVTGPVETSYSKSTSGGNETITITRPDGSTEKQITNSSGFYFENQILSGTDLLSKTKTYFATGAYNSIRPTRIDRTDSLGQMAKTDFTYGSTYNQVATQKEYNYGETLYRETRFTYENSWEYTNRHIFNLVKSVDTYNASNVRLSRKEFQLDNNAIVNPTANHGLTAAPDVVQHDETSDAHTTSTVLVDGENCTYWMLVDFGPYGEPIYECIEWEQVPVSAYDPYSVYRGNVTRATTYVNAASLGTPIHNDFEYDVTGNQRVASTSCCEETSTEYTLDTQYSQPESITRGASSTSSPLRLSQTMAYDENTGVIISSTDVNGRTTETDYDAAARPIVVTLPTDAAITIDYGDLTNIATQTMKLDDGTTIVSKTQTERNGKGQPVVTGYHTGVSALNKTATKYDSMGRKWKVSMPYESTGSPAYWTEYTYDHLSRVTIVASQDGSTSKNFYNETITTRPDSALAPASTYPGQTVRTQDAWGRERWMRIDAFGRLVEVVEPKAAGNGAVSETGSERTSYSYNESDELVQITQGVQTRAFQYDSLGRMTRQKMAEHTATINNLGVYVGPSDPGAMWSEAFVYDSRSNLTDHTDARGVVTTYSYKISGNDDPLNRLHGISYNTAGANTTYTIAPADSVAVEYRDSGDRMQVKKVSTALASEESTYDPDGRVLDHTLTFADRDSAPLVTSYDYDASGRVTGILYPKQWKVPTAPIRSIVPSYDMASRLSGLSVNSVQQIKSMSYNAMSRTEQVVLSDGAGDVWEFYAYDPNNGFLTDQQVWNASDVDQVQHLAYGYSRGTSSGTLSGKTGQVSQMVNMLDRNKDRSYQHDALGRLVQAKGGLAAGATSVTANWTQQYSFDRYGNKTGTSESGVDKFNASITRDGLPSVSYNTVSNQVAGPDWKYDLMGNLIRGQNVNGAWQNFEYDAAGRLVVVRDASNNILESYQYGATRERLITTDSSKRTYYALGESGPIAEYTEPLASNEYTFSKAYIFTGGELLSTAKWDGFTEFIELHHPDRLGTGASSSPTADQYLEHATLPFGTPLASESNSLTSRVFTSYSRSSSTGLDYAINRTYSPGQGRFTQVDPLGPEAFDLESPQSLNLISYVRNGPTDFVDPEGLMMSIPYFCAAEYSCSGGSWSIGGIGSWLGLLDSIIGWGGGGGGGGFAPGVPRVEGNTESISSFTAGGAILVAILNLKRLKKILTDPKVWIHCGTAAMAVLTAVASCLEGFSPDCYKSVLESLPPVADCLATQPEGQLHANAIRGIHKVLTELDKIIWNPTPGPPDNPIIWLPPDAGGGGRGLPGGGMPRLPEGGGRPRLPTKPRGPKKIPQGREPKKIPKKTGGR